MSHVSEFFFKSSIHVGILLWSPHRAPEGFQIGEQHDLIRNRKDSVNVMAVTTSTQISLKSNSRGDTGS